MVVSMAPPPSAPSIPAHPAVPTRRVSRPSSGGGGRGSEKSALGCPRYFFAGSTHVYAVLSSRARGLSLGINLNPDQACNCECCYCEVDRRTQSRVGSPVQVNAHAIAAELSSVLAAVGAGKHLEHPYFSSLPRDMMRLVHVALSGDGEPTLCPNFAEVVEGIVHLRAAGLTPYFKLVLITNGTLLDQPGVRAGLRLFTRADEIWVKLDAGTAEAVERVNRPSVSFDRILSNIRDLGQTRPLVIQSMFVELDGLLPERHELSEYARRLNELKDAGTKIALVQIYSATRPPHSRRCRHLSLRVLSEIATFVHQATRLRVEVF